MLACETNAPYLPYMHFLLKVNRFGENIDDKMDRPLDEDADDDESLRRRHTRMAMPMRVPWRSGHRGDVEPRSRAFVIHLALRGAHVRETLRAALALCESRPRGARCASG